MFHQASRTVYDVYRSGFLLDNLTTVNHSFERSSDFMLQNLKAQKLCSFGANAAFSTPNHLTADNIMLDACILVPKG